jgi:hypothetical protein
MSEADRPNEAWYGRIPFTSFRRHSSLPRSLDG